MLFLQVYFDLEWDISPTPLDIGLSVDAYTLAWGADLALLDNTDNAVLHYDDGDANPSSSYINPQHGISWEFPETIDKLFSNWYLVSGTFSIEAYQTVEEGKVANSLSEYAHTYETSRLTSLGISIGVTGGGASVGYTYYDKLNKVQAWASFNY